MKISFDFAGLEYAWMLYIVGYLFCIITLYNWNRWNRTFLIPLPIPFSLIMGALSCVSVFLGTILMPIISISIALAGLEMSWLLYLIYIVVGIIYLVIKNKIHITNNNVRKIININAFIILVSGAISLLLYICVLTGILEKVKIE